MIKNKGKIKSIINNISRFTKILLITNFILTIVIIFFVFKFSIISLIIKKINTLNYKEQYVSYTYKEWKESVFEVLPNNEGEIVFLGDSITDLGEWGELLPEFKHVINRGILSNTTIDVLNRLDEVVYSKPNIIFLMIGINDIGNGRNLKDIVSSYNDILIYIIRESPNSKIYIESVLPCNYKLMENNVRNNRRTTKNINNLNNELKSLSNNYSQVSYVDLSFYFEDSNNQLREDLTLDGIHPNGAGYLLWASIINEYI